ncbi:hypothetical protein M413DRAFT_265541 [Hebeloma cylindrosporum]|uniref:Uncharacterized protein n=1 Tax=Hebeloma cylindrosporum TaxID=76867 RepID=A0A0C2YAP7_HEBCY|nr:hypothetical protein M413DRAFT_265541 [Hebeloma cylindrosporum h7]
MSMTAVSAKETLPPTSNTPTPTTRPSNAIQKGADLILQLVEDERANLTRLHQDGQKALQSGFQDFRTKHEAALTAAETKISLQQKLIEDLVLQSQKGSSQELEELRSENERLKASLSGVGLEYVDGSLRFDEPTARVVEEFVHGARLQDAQLAGLLGSEVQVRLIPEEHLSEPVGPTEFFGVLAGVLEKGRRFATEFEKRKTVVTGNGELESKVASIKDTTNTVTTQPPAAKPQTQDPEITRLPQSPIESPRSNKRPSPFSTPCSPAKVQKTT